ncbi:hypothetical protein ACSXEW_16715 (plasmid) [Clostridium perfringens]
MRKIEINYNNTENLINNLRTILNGLDDEQRNIKQALGEIYDLENYYRNRNEIIDELEFRERKIHDDIRNTEELIKSIELFSRNVQETDERLAHKFKKDIKSYAKVNNLELVSDFEKWLNGIQTGLDAWGTLSPGPVADGLNGLIYFLRGDMKNGLISLAGIVPYAGDSLKGVRYLDKASDILKYTDKAVDLKKSSKKVSKATDKLNIKDIDFKIGNKLGSSKIANSIDMNNSYSYANNYIDYLRYKSDLAKSELKEVYPKFVKNKNSKIAQTSDYLLERELEFGAYGKLEKVPYDNITGHHMPSNHYMKEKYYIPTNESSAFNLEQISPGMGGRHRRTFTYGLKGRNKDLYLNLMPRDALAFDINDVRRILKEDGLYNKESRQALLNYIKHCKNTKPGIFKK